MSSFTSVVLLPPSLLAHPTRISFGPTAGTPPFRPKLVPRAATGRTLPPRRWRGEFIEAWRKGAFPYIWHPGRLARCPRTACRRARRCVRPEMVDRGPPNAPSCPLVTDEEWDVWGTAVLRILLRRQKEQWAAEEEALRAEQEARRRKR